IQFRSEDEFACMRGDRFVVRSYSPMTTVGGGIILDSMPARHRKADPSTLAALEAKERGTPVGIIETVLQRYPAGLGKKELSGISGFSSGDMDTALQHLSGSGKVILLPADRLIHVSLLNSLTERALSLLEAYHERFPLRSGLPKEELRTALGR